MHMLTADMVVRLHVDAVTGLVWYGDHEQPGDCTGLDTWDFLDKDCYRDILHAAKVIRLLGIRANAPLITKLHERRSLIREFADAIIQIGAPTAVPGAWLRTDPRAVVSALWQPTYRTALLGRWHELSGGDYYTYAMITALGDRPGRVVPDVTRRIAEHHPAWPALTFVSTVDADAACRLVCDIVDPRWYAHLGRPGRQTRLHAHLGLTPGNVAACGDGGRQGRHFDRAATAVSVWYNRLAQKTSRGPNDFLLRSLDRQASLSSKLLVGTRRLVDFVAAVWADAVSVRSHPECGFDPSRFFVGRAEASAFRHHLAACRAA